MSIKDGVLSRGKARPAPTVEIETPDGRLVFKLPQSGPEIASYRRARKAWVDLQASSPNPAWVTMGLMPAGGYEEAELSILYDVHAFSCGLFTEQDVLEMYAANAGAIVLWASKIGEKMAELMGQVQAEEIAEKKGGF